MRPERFELVLERLRPSAWERFERLASVFLISDFPDLQTVASPSGDQGRDAFLFAREIEPLVMFQYSVTEAWAPKIRETAKRISATFSHARILIYVTNQAIGTAGDTVRDELQRDLWALPPDL
jgi:hypothetical protein